MRECCVRIRVRKIFQYMENWVVPTKQCGSIISVSYISCLMAAYREKSGVYKVKQGGILKPALLCRDYRKLNIID